MGGEDRQSHEKQGRPATQDSEVTGDGVAQRGTGSDGTQGADQRRPGHVHVEGACAGEEREGREDEREQQDDEDVLQNRDAEHGAGQGPPRVEFVHQGQRQRRGRGGGDRAEHQCDGEGVAERLMYREGEPWGDG